MAISYFDKQGKPIHEEYKTIRILKDPFILQPFVNKKRYYTPEDLDLIQQAIDNTRKYYHDNSINPYHENLLQLKQNIKHKEERRRLAKEMNRRWAEERKKPILAYIYLMYDPGNDVYKIGKSKDVKSRLGNIKTGNINVKLIAHTSSPVNHMFECRLHEKYQSKRVEGEWFKLDEDDIKNIQYYFKALTNE